MFSILMTATSCLSMIYYPARVAEPGTLTFGMGIREINEENNVSTMGSVYSRYAFQNGYDIGLDLRFSSIFPSVLSLSTKKQISFKDNSVIDGMNLGIGFGNVVTMNVFLPEIYMQITLLKNDISLTSGIGRIYTCATTPDFGDVVTDNFFFQIGYDVHINTFAITPFGYFQVFGGEMTGLYNYMNFESFMYPTRGSYAGVGVKFYFNI